MGSRSHSFYSFWDLAGGGEVVVNDVDMQTSFLDSEHLGENFSGVGTNLSIKDCSGAGLFIFQQWSLLTEKSFFSGKLSAFNPRDR